MATATAVAMKDVAIAAHAAKRVLKAAMRAVETDVATAAGVVVAVANVVSAKAQAHVNAWMRKAAPRK